MIIIRVICDLFYSPHKPLDDWVAGYVNQTAMKLAKKIKEVGRLVQIKVWVGLVKTKGRDRGSPQRHVRPRLE